MSTSFRFRFCCRHFRSRRPDVVRRYCLTSDSNTRSWSTTQGHPRGRRRRLAHRVIESRPGDPRAPLDQARQRQISARLPDDVAEGTETNGAQSPGYDAASIAELQRAWGVEGQPFAWSIGCVQVGAGWISRRCQPAGGVDGRAARRRRSRRPACRRLQRAAAVARCHREHRFAAELADAHGSVEVRRRGGNGDELVVDVAVKAPDGSTCVDIRGLTYAAVESAPVQAAPETSSPPVESLAGRR